MRTFSSFLLIVVMELKTKRWGGRVIVGHIIVRMFSIRFVCPWHSSYYRLCQKKKQALLEFWILKFYENLIFNLFFSYTINFCFKISTAHSYRVGLSKISSDLKKITLSEKKLKSIPFLFLSTWNFQVLFTISDKRYANVTPPTLRSKHYYYYYVTHILV